MESARILVVYYSRTGTTRKVAQALAPLLRADIEEIADTRNRMGLIGYRRSGNDAFFKRKTILRQPIQDPASYDLVVVGSPVWMMSLSAPVRTYLALMQARLPRVAFFLTHNWVGADRVFKQMQEVCGKAPIARIAFKAGQVLQDVHLAEMRRFAEQLTASVLPRPVPMAPTPPIEHAPAP